MRVGEFSVLFENDLSFSNFALNVSSFGILMGNLKMSNPTPAEQVRKIHNSSNHLARFRALKLPYTWLQD